MIGKKEKSYASSRKIHLREKERKREKRYFSYIILHIQKYIHRIFIRGDIYRKLVSVQKEMSDGARQKRERDKKGKEKI